MAQCRRCKRKGLFFRVNFDGLCIDCIKEIEAEKKTSEMNLELNRLKEEIEKEEKEFDAFLLAEREIQALKDDAKLLEFYEKTFLVEKNQMNSQSRWFKMVDLYIEFDKYDRAWNWLNELAINRPDYIAKIESYKSKVLKKEGKRPADAAYHLMNSIGYNDIRGSHREYYEAIGREDFFKKVKPLIKKAGFKNEDDIAALELILSSCITDEKFDAEMLSNKYEVFLMRSDHSLQLSAVNNKNGNHQI